MHPHVKSSVGGKLTGHCYIEKKGSILKSGWHYFNIWEVGHNHFYSPISNYRMHIAYFSPVCHCLVGCFEDLCRLSDLHIATWKLLSFSLSVVNFNLPYYFWSVRDRDLIIGMHTPRMIAFWMTPRSVTFCLRPYINRAFSEFVAAGAIVFYKYILFKIIVVKLRLELQTSFIASQVLNQCTKVM